MNLTLHLTRRCNLRCTYCYADCISDKGASEAAAREASADMSLETAKRAVEFGLSHSGASVQFGFFGGEPTLRPDLLEAIAAYATARADDLGKTVAFELTTNGTRVTDRLISLIHRYQMMVAVSVDGAPEVHDTHRKLWSGAGASRALEPGLTRLLGEVPWLMAYSVTTPATVSRLAESARWLIERGFPVVMTWPDQSAAWSREELDVMEQQFAELARLYVQWTRGGKKFFLSSIDGAIRAHVRGNDSSCRAGRDHFSVSARGRLYPCVQFVGDDTDLTWALGDVEHGLDPERLKAAAPHLEGTPETCRSCALVDRCASACPCANLTATGHPGRVSPIQCATQQLLIPAADRAAEELYRSCDALFVHKHYNDLYPVAHRLERARTVGGAS